MGLEGGLCLQRVETERFQRGVKLMSTCSSGNLPGVSIDALAACDGRGASLWRTRGASRFALSITQSGTSSFATGAGVEAVATAAVVATTAPPGGASNEPERRVVGGAVQI